MDSSDEVKNETSHVINEHDQVASMRRIYIALFGMFFAALASLGFGFIADLSFGRERWQNFVLENFELVIGMPMSAALAFAIVMIFYSSFVGEPLTAKIGPLEVKGPAGPILLWVVCLVAIVWGISLLSRSI